MFWLGHQILIVLHSEFWDEMSKPSTFNLAEMLGRFVTVTAQTNVPQVLWLQQSWGRLTHMADPHSCVPRRVKKSMAQFSSQTPDGGRISVRTKPVGSGWNCPMKQRDIQVTGPERNSVVCVFQ